MDCPHSTGASRSWCRAWRVARVITTPVRFVLASASPARRALLQAAGIEPEVVVSGVDEDAVSGPPAELALVLAEQKAHAVADRLARASDDGTTRPTLVLGCDSVLERSGLAYGKPADAADAVAMWRDMRGQKGVLHTGHCLVLVGDADDTDLSARKRSVSALASATVRFGSPSDGEIDAYVATGEPLLVAGGFTLDRLGGWFVDGIDGDPGTVLGLSLPLLRQMLADLGIEVPSLWSR